jgi:hypothetical protein
VLRLIERMPVVGDVVKPVLDAVGFGLDGVELVVIVSRHLLGV